MCYLKFLLSDPDYLVHLASFGFGPSRSVGLWGGILRSAAPVNEVVISTVSVLFAAAAQIVDRNTRIVPAPGLPHSRYGYNRTLRGASSVVPAAGSEA